MITLSRDDGPMRFPLIVNDDGRDILVQVDYDYPGVASSFGWSVASVTHDAYGRLTSNGYGAACEHDGTDGTVPCQGCGTSALTFIDAASEYLREHVGDTADDPGYFIETYIDAHGNEYHDMTAERCPYTVGRSQCVAGARGHPGRHDWPLLCESRKRGRLCERVRGHSGLHYTERTACGVPADRYYWPPRISRRAVPMR